MDTADHKRTVSQAGAPRSQSSLKMARRKLVVLLAGVALVAAAAVATATDISKDGATSMPLQQALGAVFADGRCVTAIEASTEMRVQLDAVGYRDWTIQSTGGGTPGGCVAAGFVTSDRAVVLIPVDRPEVADAMRGVATELMSRCLDKAEATELITSVLAGIGETNWSIRTDGPRAYPIEQREAVMKRIDAGCFVYSGTGSDASGRVYYISGPVG